MRGRIFAYFTILSAFFMAFSSGQYALADNYACGLNIDPTNPAGYPTAGSLPGVRWVRVEFKDCTYSNDPNSPEYRLGEAIASYQSVVNHYNAQGIGVLLILDYMTFPEASTNVGGFAQRARIISQSITGQVAYQIWNEPDLAHVGNILDPVQFANLMSTTVQAMGASPFIVTGSTASGNPPWMTAVKNAMGSNWDLIDAVAMHTYGKSPGPAGSQCHFNQTGYLFDLMASVDAQNWGKPIWITEIGYNDIDQVNQANYLSCFFSYIRSNNHNVQNVMWFAWSDGMVQPHGIVDVASNRKQSYYSYFSQLGCTQSGQLPGELNLMPTIPFNIDAGAGCSAANPDPYDGLPDGGIPVKIKGRINSTGNVSLGQSDYINGVTVAAYSGTWESESAGVRDELNIAVDVYAVGKVGGMVVDSNNLPRRFAVTGRKTTYASLGETLIDGEDESNFCDPADPPYLGGIQLNNCDGYFEFTTYIHRDNHNDGNIIGMFCNGKNADNYFVPLPVSIDPGVPVVMEVSIPCDRDSAPTVPPDSYNYVSSAYTKCEDPQQTSAQTVFREIPASIAVGGRNDTGYVGTLWQADYSACPVGSACYVPPEQRIPMDRAERASSALDGRNTGVKNFNYYTIRTLKAGTVGTPYGFIPAPIEVGEVTGSIDRANRLREEVDYIDSIGAVGYLYWMYSGNSSQGGQFGSDPYSFFEGDPICDVLRESRSRFNFVGVNVPNLINSGAYQSAIDYLQTCGVNKIRFFASPDRNGLQGAAVAQYAQSRGMSSIVVICDFANSCTDLGWLGSGRDPTSWYESGYLQPNPGNLYEGSFMDYATAIASAYRNISGITYELMNEPHCNGVSTCVPVYNSWAAAVSTRLRATDPDAQVSIGQMAGQPGTRGDSAGAGVPPDFQVSNSAGNVTMTSGHYYTDSEKAQMAVAANISAALNKPFYIGEIGLECTGEGCAPTNTFDSGVLASCELFRRSNYPLTTDRDEFPTENRYMAHGPVLSLSAPGLSYRLYQSLSASAKNEPKCTHNGNVVRLEQIQHPSEPFDSSRHVLAKEYFPVWDIFKPTSEGVRSTSYTVPRNDSYWEASADLQDDTFTRTGRHLPGQAITENQTANYEQSVGRTQDNLVVASGYQGEFSVRDLDSLVENEYMNILTPPYFDYATRGPTVLNLDEYRPYITHIGLSNDVCTRNERVSIENISTDSNNAMKAVRNANHSTVANYKFITERTSQSDRDRFLDISDNNLSNAVIGFFDMLRSLFTEWWGNINPLASQCLTEEWVEEPYCVGSSCRVSFCQIVNPNAQTGEYCASPDGCSCYDFSSPEEICIQGDPTGTVPPLWETNCLVERRLGADPDRYPGDQLTYTCTGETKTVLNTNTYIVNDINLNNDREPGVVTQAAAFAIPFQPQRVDITDAGYSTMATMELRGGESLNSRQPAGTGLGELLYKSRLYVRAPFKYEERRILDPVAFSGSNRDPTDPTNPPSGGGCNEFQCGSQGGFEPSLACAIGVMQAARSENPVNPTWAFIDRYGPWCHNEAFLAAPAVSNNMAYCRVTGQSATFSCGSGCTCDQFQGGAPAVCSGNSNVPAGFQVRCNAYLPFAHNLFNFYDQYATGSAVRAQGLVPPRDLPLSLAATDTQNVLLNGNCTQTYGASPTRRPGYGPFDYYRSAIVNDPVPNNYNWPSDADAQALYDRICVNGSYSYGGYGNLSTPHNCQGGLAGSRVGYVLRASQQANVNPWLVLGIWATESWWGMTCAP